MTISFQNIKNEITAHPRERSGFSKPDAEALEGMELSEAAQLLINAITEGDERCSEPLKWLMKDNFSSFLEKNLLHLEKDQQGYFFICNELFKESRSKAHLEMMKNSLRSSNRKWEMKASALGRVLKSAINNQSEFNNFCFDLLDSNIESPVKKIAFINILESYGQKPLQNGLTIPQTELFSKIESSDIRESKNAIKILKQGNPT